MQIVFDLNNYMKQCNIKLSEIDKLDLELLSSFVEAIYDRVLHKKVIGFFKLSKNPFSYCKYIIAKKENNKSCTVLKFYSTGFVDINDQLEEKEQNAVSQAFKRWCDIIEFERERSEKHDSNAETGVW